MTDWYAKADSSANRLVETDRQVAELRSKYERDRQKARRKWSAIFLRVEGSVEARKAQAETHSEYELAKSAEFTSLLEFEALRNERDTCVRIIDFWRSWNKAKTEGQI